MAVFNLDTVDWINVPGYINFDLSHMNCSPKKRVNSYIKVKVTSKRKQEKHTSTSFVYEIDRLYNFRELLASTSLEKMIIVA